MYHSTTSRFLLALLLVAAPYAGAKNKEKESKHDPEQIGNRAVDKGINFYSLDREIAMGREMAREAERQAKLLDDSVVAEYVNRLGQNLARHSDAKVPFTIKVVDSDEINAFALPGGFMFVNTGLIFRAENEAEMAGVMAHEIAHVAARHGTRQASRGQLINYGTIPLIFMGGWAGYAIRQVANIAIPMGYMKFSRGMEAEADLLGVQYMYEAGYDPNEFVNFFEKIATLEKRKPGAVSRLFSTHPMTGDRIHAAQKEIQQDLRSRPEYVLDTSNFQDVKTRLTMLANRHKLSGDPAVPVLHTRSSSKADADEDGRPKLKQQ